ncbi:MAG: organic hydroperoxide resistance protein [Aestuariivirga sp.]
MKIAYTAHGHASGGGRNGIAGTDNGRLTFTMASPKELGGSDLGTNPEELFASGYAACYLGAMRFAANRDKLTMPAEATVKSSVGIGPRDDGQGFGIEVTLNVSLPGLSKADSEELTKRGHIVCPYSHSIKGNVKVTTNIV